MNAERFLNLAKTAGEVALVLFLWLLAFVIVAFNADYPFPEETWWFFDLSYYLVILFPVVCAFVWFLRWRLREKLKARFGVLVRYFHIMYLFLVVVGTLGISEMMR